jgi:hypothetical protein
MNKLEEIVSSIEFITNQMILDLESASYTDLTEFVDKRDLLIVELHAEQQSSDLAPYKARILRILEQDKLLSAKMMTFKQEAQKAIEKFQASEKYKQAYDKEYTIDSVFLNRKK